MFNHMLSLLIWLPSSAPSPVLLAGSAATRTGALAGAAGRGVAFVVACSCWCSTTPTAPACSSSRTTRGFAALRRPLHARRRRHFGRADRDDHVRRHPGRLPARGKSIEDSVAQYMAAMLVARRPADRRVRATDALLFYVFFEGMLIPMFIIIGIWGGPRRVYATLKFFIYTFLGSIFMLIGLIYLHMKTGDFALASFAHAAARHAASRRGCSSRSCSRFAIKVPMGRCTPGCRMRTSRRRPAARSCWLRSC